ncbi:MAG: hypothetical protein LBM38_03445 [Clostridiales bacterium]|jgi:hypothetical protein|nr:hypothetical protein [Clostridiales bacterium]
MKDNFNSNSLSHNNEKTKDLNVESFDNLPNYGDFGDGMPFGNKDSSSDKKYGSRPFDEYADDVKNRGEFVSTFHYWLSPQQQEDKAKELAEAGKTSDNFKVDGNNGMKN